MKPLLSISALLVALPILQIPPPPPAPQRGAAPAATQPAPLTAAECKCSIEVTVKRQSNGEPISEVTITASYNPPAPKAVAGVATAPPARVVLNAVTDISGRAQFLNLAEGTYQISAQREGYFGPFSNGNAPTQVNVTAAVGPPLPSANTVASVLGLSSTVIAGGTTALNMIRQPVQQVAIQMIQGGIISGRVRDANQRPVSNVQVAPMQVSYQNGQRMLRQNVTAVQTDDLGEFRLFWFAPGEYYLRLLLPPAQVARGGGPNFPSRTYYPGTTEFARATPIFIKDGQEFGGADVELQRGGGATISGTVINLLPGRVNPNGQVNRSISQFFLVPRNSGVIEPLQVIPNAQNNGGRGAATAADATAFPFEIRGVPTGSYDLYPIFNDGASPRSNTYTGHIPIDVGSENITGIQTAIQPGVDLKVRVTVTGAAPPMPNNRPAQPVSIQNMRIQIRPLDNLPAPLTNNLNANPTPEPDGSITFTNLPEARFFIPNISGLPNDAYVSEMRLGSRSIMDDTAITIGKETPDPLEIVISRGGGTISGTLLDTQHKPLANTRVFLIPDPPRRRNVLMYKTASSTAMGAFNFQGIAPGAYKIFAWDNIPQGAEQNDEFVSRYDALATRVIVSAGTPMTNVQVTVVQGNR